MMEPKKPWNPKELWKRLKSWKPWKRKVIRVRKGEVEKHYKKINSYLDKGYEVILDFGWFSRKKDVYTACNLVVRNYVGQLVLRNPKLHEYIRVPIYISLLGAACGAGHHIYKNWNQLDKLSLKRLITATVTLGAIGYLAGFALIHVDRIIIYQRVGSTRAKIVPKK